VHRGMRKSRVLTTSIGEARGAGEDETYKRLRKERAELGLKLLRRGVSYRINEDGQTEFRRLEDPLGHDHARRKLEAIIEADGAVVTNADLTRHEMN